MPKIINIRRGLDIRLKGEAEKVITELSFPEIIAVQPADFPGISPRILVREGAEVKAGTPLFCDRKNESILFCSPISGEVLEISRGEKRKILNVKILSDKSIEYNSFAKSDPALLERDAVKSMLLQSGVWPFIRQRPFGMIANPDVDPKSIFISAFDTNPLAPDMNFLMSGNEQDFQTGINALTRLTDGKIHLNLSADQEPAKIFTNVTGVHLNYFSGPHPAGNAGVQIHHIDPVNKGEVVWCINPQDILIIGRLFNKGIFDTTRIVACTGSELNRPQYFRVPGCTALKHMLSHCEMIAAPNRIISGNVLSGKKADIDGFLGFYDSQVTVIPATEEPEFMGWLKPGFDKFSVSRTFFSWLNPNKKYRINTLMHGEERPFVLTGEYEKVFPMDIYPVHLLKSILIGDIELMEKLGIYEVVEEDFALCEFVCTSKIASQQIIRHGLEMIRKEFN